MSDVEKSPGQSLDQILSSIRKNLASDWRHVSEAAAEAAARTASSEVDGPAAGDALTGKLALALNRTEDGGAIDAEGEPAVEASPVSAAGEPESHTTSSDTASVPEEGGPARDPLWFLRREAPQEDGAAIPRASDTEPAADEASAEALKLSRPETLRASLPPLFAEGTASRAESAKPDIRSPERASALTGAQEQNAAPLTKKSDAYASVQAAGGAGDDRQSAMSAVAGLAEGGAAQAPVAPAVSAADRRFASASKPMPAGSPQTRALEEAIAQLLDPVLRQWLETNLPPLVQAAIREEVARVLRTQRNGLKA
jgi:cell pole-organizing protein PopZ